MAWDWLTQSGTGDSAGFGGMLLTVDVNPWGNTATGWGQYGGDVVGGGEVLNVFGKKEVIYGLSETAYNIKLNAPKAIVFLTVVLMIAMVYGLIEIFGIFSSAALTNMATMVSMSLSVDRKQWQARKFLNLMIALQSRGILKLDPFKADDLTFNLQRLGWKISGIPLTAEMYNGLKIFSSAVVLAVSILLGLVTFNPVIPIIGIVLVFVITSLDTVIAMRVRQLDAEITKNFLELFLILYHTMVADGGASLASLLRVYLVTAEGEMRIVTEKIIYSLETYGEALGCVKLTDAFRHEYVTRLMRLIKGYAEGADVRDDLKGFRQLLIENREREIEHESEKLQMKARMSFYILMPVLVQAIISAMAIYFGDISSIGSFL